MSGGGKVNWGDFFQFWFDSHKAHLKLLMEIVDITETLCLPKGYRLVLHSIPIKSFIF